MTSAQAARNVNLHIFETLYARDENAKPVPELAEGVTISPDGRTYVFPIRKGVKFHNGKDLDANDVVASLERYRKVGASASLLAAIDTVKATGPSEVTVSSKDVQSTFLENLSSLALPSRSIPAEEAAKAANQINYIGTGPFRFVEYKPDSHVKLARFDDYVPNPQGTAGTASRHEDADRHRDIPLHARSRRTECGARGRRSHLEREVDGPTAKRLEGEQDFTVIQVLPFALQVIKFNHAVAPAPTSISAAPSRRPSTWRRSWRSPIPTSTRSIRPGFIRKPPSTAMRDEQVQQGRPDRGQGAARKIELQGREAHLHRRQYSRPNVDTATVVQQRLKEIGVNVELSVADWPTVSKMGFTDQGWNFWTHGFGIEPYEGPASVIAPWVNGTSQRKKDDTIDQIAVALNAEMDEGKRKEFFLKFQSHMYDNAVAMKAGNYGIFQIATAKLKNFTPYRIPRMWGVTLEPGKRPGAGLIESHPPNPAEAGDLEMMLFLARRR